MSYNNSKNYKLQMLNKTNSSNSYKVEKLADDYYYYNEESSYYFQSADNPLLVSYNDTSDLIYQYDSNLQAMGFPNILGEGLLEDASKYTDNHDYFQEEYLYSLDDFSAGYWVNDGSNERQVIATGAKIEYSNAEKQYLRPVVKIATSNMPE